MKIGYPQISRFTTIFAIEMTHWNWRPVNPSPKSINEQLPPWLWWPALRTICNKKKVKSVKPTASWLRFWDTRTIPPDLQDFSWGRYWVYTSIYGYAEFWPDSTRVKHNMSWSQMSWSKLSASFMIFTAMQSRGQAWVLLHETYCIWHKFKKNWWERNIFLPHGNVRPY